MSSTTLLPLSSQLLVFPFSLLYSIIISLTSSFIKVNTIDKKLVKKYVLNEKKKRVGVRAQATMLGVGIFRGISY